MTLKLVYKDIASPVGLMRLVAGEQGLTALLWEGEDYSRTKLPDAQKDDTFPLLQQTAAQLNAYFSGERSIFTVPLDLKGTAFQLQVWAALLQIPFGLTKTYGELARELGDIKAVRAVGGALNKNPISIIVPCHRVVGASGNLVGFAGGLRNKSILLALEQRQQQGTLF